MAGHREYIFELHIQFTKNFQANCDNVSSPKKTSEYGYLANA